MSIVIKALCSMCNPDNGKHLNVNDVCEDHYEKVMGKTRIGKSKYHREILPGVWVDVYDVLAAFEVSDAGYQHAIKKMLATGKRGHKGEAEDRKDVLASVVRSNERFELFKRKG